MDNYQLPSMIISEDPSFNHFGISIINIPIKKITLNDLQSVLGKQDFVNLSEKCSEKLLDVKEFIELCTTHPNKKIYSMEHALPWGYSAAQLMALDIQLYKEQGFDRTLVFSPTYLSFLMGKHTKKDSIKLAEALLNIFKEYGYEVYNYEDKLQDGEAEAFIYGVRAYCKLFNDELTEKIYSFCDLFKEEKEKYSSLFIY